MVETTSSSPTVTYCLVGSSSIDASVTASSSLEN